MPTRRDVIKAGAGVIALPALSSLVSACSVLGVGGSGGAGGTLQVAWWGGNDRAQRTQKVMDLYAQKNPKWTFASQFSDFFSYWDKINTQAAGGAIPDVFQMDMRYIDQYQKKGLLLDLSKFIPQPINLPDFNQVLLKGSEAEGVVYGIPFGGNFLGILYDKNLLQQAGRYTQSP